MPPHFSCVPLRSTSENCAVLPCFSDFGCFPTAHFLTFPPRTVLRGSETLRGQGVERQTLPLLGLGRGCSQRTQKAFGTAMRSCASLFRGVAAPLGCVIFFRFCRNYGFHTLCSGLSACARHGRYHYPRRALRAFETPDGRLQKRLTCRFLRSGGRSSPHDSYFLANTQNFLLAVPVANAFALWYDIIFSHLPSLGNAGGY